MRLRFHRRFLNLLAKLRKKNYSTDFSQISMEWAAKETAIDLDRISEHFTLGLGLYGG